jgi:hypothetical protein
VLLAPGPATAAPNAAAPGAGAHVSFTASPAVINATNATIAGGVLALQLAHPFETSKVQRGACRDSKGARAETVYEENSTLNNTCCSAVIGVRL